MKRAILQVADTGPLESLVMMLESVGYNCYLPDEKLKAKLRAIGCDCVLDVQQLVNDYGYAEPLSLSTASFNTMRKADLFVDVKGVRTYKYIVKEWPNLEGRVLWYRINGGEPEHVIRNDGFDCGDERNPPCPVLTPNRWYREPGEWSCKAYSFWPPFRRFNDYYSKHGRSGSYSSPVCLIHNIYGWGYSHLVDPLRDAIGLKCYGAAGSPDGLVPHKDLAKVLSHAKAMVHLKSSDAPGYALYEAMAAACPLVVSRRLIRRSHMEEMFVPGENCLVWDRDETERFNLEECVSEITEAMIKLSDSEVNRRIGIAGRWRLMELMWNADEDAQGLKNFLDSHVRK